MPQYLSTDPNADQTSQKKYLSTDPNAGMIPSTVQGTPNTGHPFLAGLARLAGGVGSAFAQPAELSGVGTVIPAAIAGAGEAAAQKLEGGSWDTPLDMKRVGMESALGAVPFGYLTKGKMLGGMVKSGAISGVGEAGREWARNEDINPVSIGLQSVLGAGTFGLLNKLFHGTPSAGPKPSLGDPIITQEPGNRVFRMPEDWTSRVTPESAMTNPNIAPEARAATREAIAGHIAKANAPIPPMSKIAQSNLGDTVRTQLGKTLTKEGNAIGGVEDLNAGISSAQKIASRNRVTNFQAENRAMGQENSADLQEVKRLLGIQKANELKAQLNESGLEPTTKFGTSESGVDANGKRIAKSTSYAPPAEEDQGGGGGGDDGSHENPLDVLARKLGIDKPNDPFATQRAIFGMPTRVEPDVVLPTGAAIENLRPGLELPESNVPSVHAVTRDPGNIAHADLMQDSRFSPDALTNILKGESATPPSPVEALQNALTPKRSRSLKTVTGFQDALQKRIDAGGEPVVPSEPIAAPGANVAPVEPIAEPSVTPTVPNAGNLLASTDIADVNPTSPTATRTYTGAAYREGKNAFARNEISAEDLAAIRDTHLATLGRSPEGVAGLKLPSARPTPTNIMSQLAETLGVKPSEAALDIPGGTVEPSTSHISNPDAGASLAPDVPDWIKNQSEAVDQSMADKAGLGADPNGITKMRGGLGGMLPTREDLQKHPALTKLFSGATGAALGAPVGQYLDPEDPNAGVKGALAGGMLGYAGAGGPQSLINWRNAGLLATPSAQGKKPLSDLGAYIGKAAESALSGKYESETRPMLRELLNIKQNASNFGKAFKNPSLAEDVIGDTAKPYLEPAKGLLGLAARPFAAAQYATSQAMQRAGIDPEEAKNVLLLGTPQTQLAQRWLDLQKLPGWQGQAVRAIRPFARIGTNIFERGVQRIPGASMLTGDPETRMARTLLGTGALAAGAYTGASDQDTQDQGGEETSPIVRGLRRALMASYGVPFMLGESLTGPRGIRDLIYATPGATQTVPPPAPKDTLATYAGKFGKRWLDQMMPDWAVPQDWEATPQR